ncbi:MAG: hypothetical protein KDA58_00985, partial [Planctomycetaceae bacterium]|nr:hypothetical protein [Planctomycetaceae bacterium]
IQGMQRVLESVEAGERRILALGERSHAIGSIVETMGALSARTDLLALNASLESLRAGNEGKGFSVVAEEVRRLAEQTAHASREIAGLVERIQLETRETITAMAGEREQVEVHVKLCHTAGEALRQIDDESDKVAVQVTEISAATEQQFRGIQEVVKTLQKVAQLAGAIERRCGVTGESVESLTNAARELEYRITPLFRCDEKLTPDDPRELDLPKTDPDMTVVSNFPDTPRRNRVPLSLGAE